MKIALVLTPFLFKRCPLIGLAYLSSYLEREGFEVLIFDLNSEMELTSEIREEPWNEESFVDSLISSNRELLSNYADKILQSGAEIIGFSVWKTTKYISLALADMIKEKDKNRLIIFGGPECSFSGEELISKSQVDAVVYGEGEQTLTQIADIYKQKKGLSFCPGASLKINNSIVNCGPRDEIGDLDSLPFPDYSGFQQERYNYFHKISIMFNRGCWKKCVFCNTSLSWVKYRSRSAINIYEEIKYQITRYPAIKKLEVDDSALNLNLKELSKLCDLIINNGLRIDWGGAAIIHPEMDYDMLVKMARSGCSSLAYGLESGSQRVVDGMRKGFTIKDAERLVRETHEANIQVILNIIIGFPNETEHDFLQTMEFIARNREYIFFIASPSLCSIMNGTYLQKHHDEFGVSFCKNKPWESLNGVNTHEERQRRMKVLEELVRSLRLSMPNTEKYI